MTMDCGALLPAALHRASPCPSIIFRTMRVYDIVVERIQPAADATAEEYDSNNQLEASSNQRNHCKKHGSTSKGHRWQDRRKLNRDQQRKQEQTAKSHDNKRQNPAAAQPGSHGLIAQPYISNELSNVNNSTYTWKLDCMIIRTDPTSS